MSKVVTRSSSSKIELVPLPCSAGMQTKRFGLPVVLCKFLLLQTKCFGLPVVLCKFLPLQKVLRGCLGSGASYTMQQKLTWCTSRSQMSMLVTP